MRVNRIGNAEIIDARSSLSLLENTYSHTHTHRFPLHKYIQICILIKWNNLQWAKLPNENN